MVKQTKVYRGTPSKRGTAAAKRLAKRQIQAEIKAIIREIRDAEWELNKIYQRLSEAVARQEALEDADPWA